MMMSNMGEAGGGGCECVSWVWMCHTGFNTAPWFCILYPFSPQDFICLPFWSSCSVSLLWCAALLLFLTPLWFCSRGWIKWPCIGCWGLRMLPRAVFSFFFCSCSALSDLTCTFRELFCFLSDHPIQPKDFGTAHLLTHQTHWMGFCFSKSTSRFSVCLST